ncbi:MAG: DNA repair protein RecO [Desulfovibrio sp.]|jgi:DNA repair protein RecO (recombination protein O)|nr:DNA repair protein RecO [Desulfovibrio sp.]
MAKEWADHALVLRMGRFREADVWLKLLCRKRGLLTLFAFGASRSRRRFCGCLDVLNTLQCRVKAASGDNFLNLEEAVLLTGPRTLRHNWQRMGIAANCLHFVEALGVNTEGAAEAFALVEDLRQTLEQAPRLPSMLPLFFRLRLAGAAGLAPLLGQCGACGAALADAAIFLADEGQLRCTACRPAPSTGYGVDLSGASLAILRRVQNALPSAWPTEDPAPANRRACAKAVDGFVQYHLGLAFEGGRFRRI